jgi:putative ABC transport system substrate-binding protein
MRLRDFILGLGGSVAWSLPAFSQQRSTPVIGYFGAGSPGPFADRMAAFRDGLRRAGFVEGRNVAIEYRWTEDPSCRRSR